MPDGLRELVAISPTMRRALELAQRVIKRPEIAEAAQRQRVQRAGPEVVAPIPRPTAFRGPYARPLPPSVLPSFPSVTPRPMPITQQPPKPPAGVYRRTPEYEAFLTQKARTERAPLPVTPVPERITPAEAIRIAEAMRIRETARQRGARLMAETQEFQERARALQARAEVAGEPVVPPLASVQAIRNIVGPAMVAAQQTLYRLGEAGEQMGFGPFKGTQIEEWLRVKHPPEREKELRTARANLDAWVMLIEQVPQAERPSGMGLALDQMRSQSRQIKEYLHSPALDSPGAVEGLVFGDLLSMGVAEPMNWDSWAGAVLVASMYGPPIGVGMAAVERLAMQAQTVRPILAEVARGIPPVVKQAQNQMQRAGAAALVRVPVKPVQEAGLRLVGARPVAGAAERVANAQEKAAVTRQIIRAKANVAEIEAGVANGKWPEALLAKAREKQAYLENVREKMQAGVPIDELYRTEPAVTTPVTPPGPQQAVIPVQKPQLYELRQLRRGGWLSQGGTSQVGPRKYLLPYARENDWANNRMRGLNDQGRKLLAELETREVARPPVTRPVAPAVPTRPVTPPAAREAAGLVPAPAAKEPWQMTQGEFIRWNEPRAARSPGGQRDMQARARHRRIVEQALREGKSVPQEVLDSMIAMKRRIEGEVTPLTPRPSEVRAAAPPTTEAPLYVREAIARPLRAQAAKYGIDPEAAVATFRRLDAKYNFPNYVIARVARGSDGELLLPIRLSLAAPMDKLDDVFRKVPQFDRISIDELAIRGVKPPVQPKPPKPTPPAPALAEEAPRAGAPPAARPSAKGAPSVTGAWKQGMERPFAFDPNSTANQGRFRLLLPAQIQPKTYFTRRSPTPGVFYIMGKDKTTGERVVQALRFSKAEFTEAQAAQWWATNRGRFNFATGAPPPSVAGPVTARPTPLAPALATEAPGAGLPPSPPRKRPTGVPPADGFRPSTIQAIERSVRPLSIEERAARPRNIQDAFYVPGGFKETTDPLIGQFQRTPDVFDDLQGFLAGGKVKRAVGQFAEPISAAVARAARAGAAPEDIIPLAMVRRDLYVSVESAGARAGLIDWVGRNRKLLGIDKNGFARAIKPRPGTNIPQGAVQRLDDIMEFPDNYISDTTQRAALREVSHTFEAMLQKQLEAGVDIIETRTAYWARIATKVPEGVEPAHTIGGHKRMRSFRFVRDGIRAGVEYANPLDALGTRLDDGIRTIANNEVFRDIKALGETPAERLFARQPDLIAGYKAQREVYKVARAQWNKTKSPGDLALLETAKEELRRATRALLIARRKVKQPSIGEALAFGRIFPGGVVDELGKYSPELSGIEDFWQMYRGSMVAGDFSPFLVQGVNLFFRNHLQWWTAVARSVQATYTSPEAYVVKNIVVIKDGVSVAAISVPMEYLLGYGGRLSRGLAKLPLIKQTQQVFERFAFVGQTEMWKVKGFGLTGAARTEMASSVRKMLGVVLRPGLTRTQRKIEAFTLFAPKFFIAVSTQFTDATRRGVRGVEARKTLGAVFAGGTALTIAGNLAYTGKLPNFTDPDKKTWASIETPAGVINVFGPYHPYMRAFASTAKHLALAVNAPTDEKAWAELREVAEAATFLMRGKASATVGPFIDFVTGETVMGELVEQSPMGLLWAYLSRVGPIGPRQIALHMKDVLKGYAKLMPEEALEMFGGRVSPFTASQLRNNMRETVLEEMQAKGIPDIVPGQYESQPFNIKRDINDDPRVKSFAAASSAQQLERGSDYAEYKKKRGERQQKTVDLIAELAAKTLPGSPKTFRTQWAVHRRDQARDMENLEKQYGEALRFIEDLDPPTAELDIILDEYMEKVNDPALEDEATGEYDYAERDNRRMEMVRKYSEERIRKIENELHEKESLPEKQLRVAREYLRPYWEVGETLLPTLDGEARTKWQEYLAADGPRRQEMARTNLIVKRGVAQVDVRRRRMRVTDVATDYLLFFWGYTTVYEHPQNIARFGQHGERRKKAA